MERGEVARGDEERDVWGWQLAYKKVLAFQPLGH
jgi:hypothetical protein